MDGHRRYPAPLANKPGSLLASRSSLLPMKKRSTTGLLPQLEHLQVPDEVQAGRAGSHSSWSARRGVPSSPSSSCTRSSTATGAARPFPFIHYPNEVPARLLTAAPPGSCKGCCHPGGRGLLLFKASNGPHFWLFLDKLPRRSSNVHSVSHPGLPPNEGEGELPAGCGWGYPSDPL